MVKRENGSEVREQRVCDDMSGMSTFRSMVSPTVTNQPTIHPRSEASKATVRWRSMMSAKCPCTRERVFEGARPIP